MIKKPTNANTKPPNLSCASFINFNFSNIFLIFEGNKAYKAPSINKNSPKATIISLIPLLICLFRFYVSKEFEKFAIWRKN